MWGQDGGEEVLIGNESIAKAISNHVNELLKKILKNDRTDSLEVDSVATSDVEKSSTALVVSGDTVIAQSTVHDGDIFVKEGTLTVEGCIKGDVEVLKGNLVVRSTGIIEGNAHVTNGKIIKEEGAKIFGYEEITTTSLKHEIAKKELFHTSTKFNVPWNEEITDFDEFIFRYNRVESIFLGLGSDKKYYWDGSRLWNAYGFVGWGFKSHKWRGLLGLSRQFYYQTHTGNNIIDIGIEGYSLTDSKDRWRISQFENTLASLLIHEDFRDYFQRQGYTLYAGHYIQSEALKSEIKLSFNADEYESMPNRVDWAFFGGEKIFRTNPPIMDGRMRSITLFGGFSTITKTSRGPEGWQVTGSVEYSRRSLGSNIGFNQYVAEVIRFQPIDMYQSVNVRFRTATSDGVIPTQRLYELGGLGTLNAYPYKSFVGNRMLLLNTEFILSGGIFDDVSFIPSWLFGRMIFIITSDAGWMNYAPSRMSPLEGFGSIRLNSISHNLGVALGNRSGTFRIGVAWRTDVKDRVRLVMRVERPF